MKWDGARDHDGTAGDWMRQTRTSTQLRFSFPDVAERPAQRHPAPLSTQPPVFPSPDVCTGDPYSYKELERRVLALVQAFREPGRRKRARTSRFFHVSEIQ
jgi:hypothetical protein